MVDALGGFLVWKAIKVKSAFFVGQGLLAYGPTFKGFKWALSALPFIYTACSQCIMAAFNNLPYLREQIMAGETTKAPMENLPPQLVEAMKSPMGQATIQSIIGGPPEPPTYLELPTDGQRLDPDGEQVLVSATTGHLRRMLNFRRQFDSTRIKFYRQYIGQQPETKYPDNITKRSNTFVPYPLSNVEQIVSRSSDAFFAYDPWFECRPRTMADDAAAEAMQTVLGQKLKASNFMKPLMI
jgi:hypothetical protein